MLQEYLNANLLAITDEESFKKLQKAADELTKKLLKQRSKIPKYTVAAIDPNIPFDNPEVIEVKDLITKNWSTFTTNAKDTPLTYVRAVLLQALHNSAKDLDIAVLIWLSGRNVSKYFQIGTSERDIIADFLQSIGRTLNQEAYSAWSLFGRDSAQVSVDLKDFPSVILSKETLQKHLEDAVGPSNSQGSSNFDAPNPYWPNSHQGWAHNFAPRAANGIAIVFNKSLKDFSAAAAQNQKNIKEYISSALDTYQQQIFDNIMSLELRSQLIWWKEACYSPKFDESYRSFQTGELEFILANDYSALIPIVYPKSVDYFFKETYQNLNIATTEKIAFAELIETVKKFSSTSKKILSDRSDEAGRISLLQFMSGIVWGRYTPDQLHALVGFSPEATIDMGNFALWLFHDFQLEKALKSK